MKRADLPLESTEGNTQEAPPPQGTQPILSSGLTAIWVGAPFTYRKHDTRGGLKYEPAPVAHVHWPTTASLVAAGQPGRLRLERAAAGASARAEHSTVVGPLLHFGVCCELAVCRPRRLNGHPAGFQSAEVSRFGMFYRPV